MVKFIDSVTSQQIPPPYRFPGAKVHGFVWEPNMARVQAWCDTFLNIGDLHQVGVRYEALPLWPYACVMIIDYPVMVCADPGRKSMSDVPYADRGYTSQTEMFVTVPLLRRGLNLKTMALYTMIEWAIPFILVGNPSSAVCGREMIGLEKLLATFTLCDDGALSPFTCDVDLIGWPDPKSAQQTMRFFSAKAGPPLPSVEGHAYELSAASLLRSPAASRTLEWLAFARDFLDDTLNGLLPTTMQLVSLKQYRDAEFPDQAIYQALVGCRSKFSNICDFQVYNEKDVSLDFVNTGSFSQILQQVFGAPDYMDGRPGEAAPIFSLPVRAAYKFTARIDFDQMRTMHTFPVDGLQEPRPPDDWIAPWLRPLQGFLSPRAASPVAAAAGGAA